MEGQATSSDTRATPPARRQCGFFEFFAVSDVVARTYCEILQGGGRVAGKSELEKEKKDLGED